jgi:mannose-6-phosphate isomerase-like protein (cupin superfamily)
MDNGQTVQAQSPAMTLAVATTGDVRFNPGRRPEIKYRDLGVKDATHGRMRAEVMHVSAGSPAKPTGWHYHLCEMQFLYMLEGWVDLEFCDRGVVRLQAGDSMMIPGGMVHQEISASAPMELLEVSVPAQLGTVNCDPPANATGQRRSGERG